ncbi:Rib/alpha-like domain-containing protein [Limosilactobacillus ingluviei]|uniref:Rib/alpha-like domain-containing protein n=1 Tax=Limosilactobacillus ingluviei TaxID=148604 RepID=UPI00030335B2|nr:Rib/alpha-like domain-containing protein [Limosilactobacillus ingluviei]
MTVNVNSQKEQYEAEGQNITAKQGEDVSGWAGEAISNMAGLPVGTQYSWKTTPDTTTPGVKDAKVVVTYPDCTHDTVEVQVIVSDYTTDITPIVPGEATKVNAKTNLTDDEKAEVKQKVEEANKDNFPPNTQVEIGDDGKTTIKYPDGTKDEILGDELVAEKGRRQQIRPTGRRKGTS